MIWIKGAGKWLGEVGLSSQALLTWAEKIGLVIVPQISVCFVGLPFFTSANWRMPEMSRAFVHGHTLLHSWSGPMKLVVMELRYCPILQLHLLSLVRVLDIKIARSLPPQASVNRRPCQNHMQVTEAQSLSKWKVLGRLWHWGLYRYLVRASTC